MMKKTLAAAATILAISGAANAISPNLTPPSGHFIWQGDMFINTATPATPAANCIAFKVGKPVAQVMFAPRGLPNNHPTQDKFMWFPVGELTAQQWVSNTPSTSGLLNGATSVAASGVNSRRIIYLHYQPKSDNVILGFAADDASPHQACILDCDCHVQGCPKRLRGYSLGSFDRPILSSQASLVAHADEA